MVQDGKKPARLFFGKFATESARKKIAALERELTEWESVSRETDFPL